MAGIVQWGVDKFWEQLQLLRAKIVDVDIMLKADARRLGAMYETARQRFDPARDAYIAPLIHRNTVLRLQYLKPIRAKFESAVSAASSVLKRAGYTTPSLAGPSGLGVAPAVIVPAAAVGAVLLGLSAVAVVNRLTQAQVKATDAIARIFGDPNTTPEQKIALARELERALDAQRKANPPLFDPGVMVLPLAIIAAIVLGPQLLHAFAPGKRVAA